jgi:hypothetical protein
MARDDVRRESLRLLQAHVREHLTDDPELGDQRRSGGAAAEVRAAC